MYTSHALLFGDMDTCSIAEQIILCSTVSKSQFYGIADSKWVDYVYIYNIYIDKLCLNINLIEL